MKTLQVELGERSYPIVIDRNAMSNTAQLNRAIAGKTVLIVTNTIVGPLYADILATTIRELGKNMIGAFYQPQLVLADLASLNTLPQRELCAGMAEVIKHGAIYDAAYFEWLEHNIEPLMAKDTDSLAQAIVRSCEIKSEVVAQDEKESGLRAILNFGHTFGHAIETGLGYGEWLHGEAVGVGMILAADLSHRLGMLSALDATRVYNLVKAAGLPTEPPKLGVDQMIEWMKLDKKSDAGQIKFVLLDGIGKHKIQAVPEDILRQTLQVCAASY